MANAVEQTAGLAGAFPKHGAIAAALIAFCIAQTAPAGATENLPSPEPEFRGKIGLTASDSIAAWPEPVTAVAGAPNIVLIMLDDVGFADTSPFGGITQTPAL